MDHGMPNTERNCVNVHPVSLCVGCSVLKQREARRGLIHYVQSEGDVCITEMYVGINPAFPSYVELEHSAIKPGKGFKYNKAMQNVCDSKV